MSTRRPLNDRSYQPLDLSGLCNGGVDVLGDAPAPPVGEQHLRGLPFVIGNGGDQSFVVLDGSARAVTVPVDAPTRTVVFAHRLLASELRDGGPLGVHVADYLFHFDDAEPVRVPVRERFEIGMVGTPWFGRIAHPYRAVTDTDDFGLPRHEGRWGGRWAPPGRNRAWSATRLLPVGVAEPPPGSIPECGRDRAAWAAIPDRRDHHRHHR